MLSLVMKTISAQNKVCEKNNNISANEMKFRKIYKLYFITVEILNNLSDLFFFSYKIGWREEMAEMLISKVSWLDF
jgi:hypothetical protein